MCVQLKSAVCLEDVQLEWILDSDGGDLQGTQVGLGLSERRAEQRVLHCLRSGQVGNSSV